MKYVFAVCLFVLASALASGCASFSLKKPLKRKGAKWGQSAAPSIQNPEAELKEGKKRAPAAREPRTGQFICMSQAYGLMRLDLHLNILPWMNKNCDSGKHFIMSGGNSCCVAK